VEFWACGLAVDLGASTLRVATWRGAEILAHPALAMPACIALTSAGKVLLGHEAKSASQQNPGNAFQVGTLLRKLHAAREADTEGLEPPPHVTASSVRGQPREFLVAELLAILLWRLRDLAQEEVGGASLGALVMSVPGMCGMVQRRTLEEAAKLAGFRRARLLRAPVGAALWRYFGGGAASGGGGGGGVAAKERAEAAAAKERQVLLVDVGAGHLDCALVVIEQEVFEVRWAGGCACGGGDIDRRLAALCTFRSGVREDVATRPSCTSQRLLGACEKAKRALTTSGSTRLHLPHAWEDCKDLDVVVSLQEFEEALRNTVLRTLTCGVRDLVQHGDSRGATMPDHRNIDEVVLLGGSVAVPCVRRALQALISKELGLHIPEPTSGGGSCCLAAGGTAGQHANACGSALQGAILGERRSDDGPLQHLMLIDTSSYSLGVCVGSDDSPVWVVPAHTPIPTTKDIRVRLRDAAQPGAVLHLREDAGLGGGPGSWLGALVVPAPPSLPRPSATRRAEEEVGNRGTALFRVRLEVDVAGRAHVDVTAAVGDSDVEGGEDGAAATATATDDLLRERASSLSRSELETLSAALHAHAGDRWARYGQRPALPPRAARPPPRLEWPSWPVELVREEEEEEEVDEEREEVMEEEAEETDSGARSSQDALCPHCGIKYRRKAKFCWQCGKPRREAAAAAEETPPGAPAGQGPAAGRRHGGAGVGGGGGTDQRGCVLRERLRRKVRLRGQQNCDQPPGHSSSEAVAAVGREGGEGGGGEAEEAGDACENGLSTTEVCAVCLCTESELGRPFPWVMEKCGHKCICKPCLRKMKARRKCVEVECPLCRVRSKPVLLDRYEGDIYVAQADP